MVVIVLGVSDIFFLSLSLFLSLLPLRDCVPRGIFDSFVINSILYGIPSGKVFDLDADTQSGISTEYCVHSAK